MPCRPSTSTSRVRLPPSASASASAAATVVLPVPPLPVTTCNRAVGRGVTSRTSRASLPGLVHPADPPPVLVDLGDLIPRSLLLVLARQGHLGGHRGLPAGRGG